MTEWVAYPTSVGLGADAQPLSSQIAIEVVRQNLACLLENSPAYPAFWIDDAVGSPLSSVQTAFTAKGSVLARWPRDYLRCRGHTVRGVRVHVLAATDGGGNTGTLRASAGPGTGILATPGGDVTSPPSWPRTYVDTATGAVTGTRAWHKLDIPMAQANARRINVGTRRSDRGAISYFSETLVLQAITGGAGTVYVYAATVGEYHP